MSKRNKKIITVCEGELKAFKDLQIHMEHPFFSLSKRPVFTETRYEYGKDWIEITASSKGRATIYDKDILVFIISQIRKKMLNNESVTRHVTLNIKDYFRQAGKSAGGRGYKLLIDALDRLDGTRIKTNITGTDGVVDTKRYGMIDGYHITRKGDKIDGRILSCVVTLSEKVFHPIIKSKPDILTVNPKIFRLTKPKEKRIYDIVRKHIGRKESWKIGIEKLAIKIGSNTENMITVKKELRRSIRMLIDNHQKEGNFEFPDFIVRYDKKRDIVSFLQKTMWWKTLANTDEFKLPEFDTSIYEDAKKIAPDFDVYILKVDFDKWVFSNIDKFTLKKEPLQKAFLGMCKKRQTKKQGQQVLL